jgi:hypothetical protein
LYPSFSLSSFLTYPFTSLPPHSPSLADFLFPAFFLIHTLFGLDSPSLTTINKEQQNIQGSAFDFFLLIKKK